MAALLPLLVEAGLLECRNACTAGETWQLAHTARTSVSKRSSGTGSPSSLRVMT
jgi:hypothetical protein